MRRLKQLVAMILVVCMLITLCPSDVSARTSKAAVKSVTVTNLVTNKLVLKKGTKFRVKPRVVVTGKISKKVTYVSSNKKIVTVDNKGVVKAVKSGKAVVAVKSAANPKVMYRFNVYVGVPTKTVKLSAKAVNMFKGTSRTLKASIAPKNATYKRIQWSSSDKRIATVSSKGVVKAVKVGRVYITAKAMDGSGKYARCKITVKQPVTSIKLSAATLTITEGSSKTLTATVAPASATNKTLSWTSSNKKIATVSAKGVVKAIAPGTATITAKAADGSGKKATCKVTVNKKVTVENKYESQGYKLLWHDEFDGSVLDPARWQLLESMRGSEDTGLADESNPAVMRVEDSQLKLIHNALEKKIKNELHAMLANDRTKYEEFWKEFGRQIKFGAYSDYGMHAELLRDLLLFWSAKEQKMVTLQEYVDKMPAEQKYIYFAAGDSSDRLAKLPSTELVLGKGYDVLLLTEDVDEFCLQILRTYPRKDAEGKDGTVEFKNVNSGDLGLETEEEKKAAEDATAENKDLFDAMKTALDGKVKEVKVSTRLKDHPVCLSADGPLSIEMEKVLSKQPGSEGVKSDKVLELNANHPVFAVLKAAQEAGDTDKINKYSALLYAQAQLIEGLPVDDPTAYAEAVCSLMK